MMMMVMFERYNKFIVQSLIGNSKWSSQQAKGKFFHCGSIPNKKGEIFCSDLRVMIMGTKEGFKPVAIYARSARKPLLDKLTADSNSWDILGTNLSVKMPDGSFTTESDRLRLMDTKDFNTLGLGLDDLIEAYVQTVRRYKNVIRACPAPSLPRLVGPFLMCYAPLGALRQRHR
jgi:hypothetical protein